MDAAHGRRCPPVSARQPGDACAFVDICGHCHPPVPAQPPALLPHNARAFDQARRRCIRHRPARSRPVRPRARSGPASGPGPLQVPIRFRSRSAPVRALPQAIAGPAGWPLPGGPLPAGCCRDGFESQIPASVPATAPASRAGSPAGPCPWTVCSWPPACCRRSERGGPAAGNPVPSNPAQGTAPVQGAAPVLPRRICLVSQPGRWSFLRHAGNSAPRHGLTVAIGPRESKTQIRHSVPAAADSRSPRGD